MTPKPATARVLAESPSVRMRVQPLDKHNLLADWTTCQYFITHSWPMPSTRQFFQRQCVIRKWLPTDTRKQMSSFSMAVLCVWVAYRTLSLMFQVLEFYKLFDKIALNVLPCSVSVNYKNIYWEKFKGPHIQESQWQWRHLPFPLRRFICCIPIYCAALSLPSSHI